MGDIVGEAAGLFSGFAHRVLVVIATAVAFTGTRFFVFVFADAAISIPLYDTCIARASGFISTFSFPVFCFTYLC